MKNVIIAAIAGITLMGTVGIVTSAQADGMNPPLNAPAITSDRQVYGFDALTYNGDIAYNLTDEAFTGDLGAKYRIAPSTQLTGSFYFSDTDTTVMKVDNYRLGVEHELNYAVNLYGYAELDADMNHENTTVGMSFDF